MNNKPARAGMACLFLTGIALLAAGRCLAAGPAPFKPGEKLLYSVYLGDFPAGELRLSVAPMTAVGGAAAYHFVMTSQLSPLVSELLLPGDRIESYADSGMTHALLYREYAGGSPQPAAAVTFDWAARQARYSQGGKKYRPTPLLPGAFDPLSLIYAVRMFDLGSGGPVAKPVTDGLHCAIARATVRGRQRLRLESGQYDAFLVEAPLAEFSDMFSSISASAALKLWISADARRLPVRMDCEFPVGTCRIELKAVR